MHFLYVQDWQEFEGISDKLLQENPAGTEVVSQVHSFMVLPGNVTGSSEIAIVVG